jgi:gag-polypeptide of LTR copia-type
MSSLSQNTPSDSLPSTVPKLDPTGSNWAIFSIRFQEALSARDRWGHFDGTKPKPKPEKSDAPKQEELDAIASWEKEERIARYMLSQKLPDSAVVRVHKLDTVAEKWNAVLAEYTKKGLFARMEMRNTFMSSRCPPGVDIPRFLIDLGTRREELIPCGVTVDDADYRSTILNAIPSWLRRFASSVHASASVANPTFLMEPDVLSRMVSEEYERSASDNRNNRDGRTYQKNDKRDDGNAALATFQATPSTTRMRTPGVCWGCGQSGHMRSQCPNIKVGAPKTSGAGAPVSGTANAAEPEDDDEADGVWAVLEVEDGPEARDEVLGFFVGTSPGEDPACDGYADDVMPGLVESDDEYPAGEEIITYRYVDEEFVESLAFDATASHLGGVAGAEVTNVVVVEAKESSSGLEGDVVDKFQNAEGKFQDIVAHIIQPRTPGSSERPY